MVAHAAFVSGDGAIKIDLLAQLLSTVERSACLSQHLAAGYVGNVILTQRALPKAHAVLTKRPRRRDRTCRVGRIDELQEFSSAIKFWPLMFRLI